MKKQTNEKDENTLTAKPKEPKNLRRKKRERKEESIRNK